MPKKKKFTVTVQCTKGFIFIFYLKKGGGGFLDGNVTNDV